MCCRPQLVLRPRGARRRTASAVDPYLTGERCLLGRVDGALQRRRSSTLRPIRARSKNGVGTTRARFVERTSGSQNVVGLQAYVTCGAALTQGVVPTALPCPRQHQVRSTNRAFGTPPLRLLKPFYESRAALKPPVSKKGILTP